MMKKLGSNLVLVLGVSALLIVLMLGGPAHASLELSWHGPDMHSSLPHPAPGSALITLAAQAAASVSGSIPIDSSPAVETVGFRVVSQVAATRLDHPPR
jgi:hypothetical protein